jgi:Fic family protein
MSDLELFLNNEDIHVPHLIRIGIAHYQFETIHPFLDGNGRLGRLLITLYLVSNKILSKPALYLSDFFERNRNHYYTNLTLVREQSNLKQWLTFFLVGVNETAQNAIDTFKKIIDLRTIVNNKILSLGKRTDLAKKFLEFLFLQPIVEASQVAKELRVNISTANRLIESFVKLNILIEQTGFRRNRIFIFEDYVKLFR